MDDPDVAVVTSTTGSASIVTPPTPSVFPDPIVIKGSHFFYETNGSQFFIRGITYTPPLFVDTGLTNYAVDPFDRAAYNCTSDILPLLSLGINTIYLQGLHSDQDHQDCMKDFRKAGIYIIVELSFYDDSSTTQGLILGETNPSWDSDLYDIYSATIGSFAKFSNVLGFVIGSDNGIANRMNLTDGLPFVKAAARDIKALLNSSQYRQIPIGFMGQNDALSNELSASYLNCGDMSESVDFWALQVTWCGTENETQTFVSTYESFGIPVFFGFYDCFSNENYTEIGDLYASQMAEVFSGGFLSSWQEIVFMYTENLDYTTVEDTPDYTNVSRQFAAISPSPTQSGTYQPANARLESCPTSDSAWNALKTLAPTPNDALCNCMYASLPCTVPQKWKNNSFSLDAVIAQNWTAQVGIWANGTNATYGAYSVCSKYQRVSWAISQIYNDQIALGKTPTCNNFTDGSPHSPSTSDHTCYSMLASAGPLGDQVAAPSSTFSTGIDPTGDTYEEYSSASTLSPGGIAGIVIAVIAVVTTLAGSAFFLWRKRKAKATQRSLSPNGLELDTGQFSKIELSAEGLKQEMWTNRNTTELPASIGLRIPDSANRGSYTSVANEERDESTGEAAELESNFNCSPYLGDSPGASPNTSPHQGSVSPMSPRLSEQVVSTTQRTTEVDAEFAMNHEYRESSHPSQAS